MKQMKTSFPFVAYADSRQGGRRENQDSCVWGDTPAGFLVTVCDGMGGGPSGKEASSMAAQNLCRYIQEFAEEEKDRQKLMRSAIDAANRAILDAVAADSSKKGMGTTLTALLINEYSAVIAHVGDSRVYQFRHGRKHFRTNDHSYVFAKLKEGEIRSEEEARTHPDSNIILRALGISETVKPEIVELAYEKRDRFMLCTDGIWGMFPEKAIVSIAAKTKALSGAVESMVVQVDEEGVATGGGHDNLTIALLETNSNSIMKEKMSTRQKSLFLTVLALCLVSVLLNVYLLQKKTPDAGPGAPASSEVEDLVYVVSGLKEELAETQSRLAQAELNHAQFVDEVKNEVGNSGRIAKRAEQEQKSINEKKAKRESLKKELESIISRTEELQKMLAKPGDEAKKKETEVKAVLEAFEGFAQNAQKTENQDVKNVIQWLSEPIARQDDVNYTHRGRATTAGQYNAILDAMGRILNTI